MLSKNFSLVEGAIVVANATLTTLATFVPAADTLLPGSELTPVHHLAMTSSGMMQGMIPSKTQPSYPDVAIASDISGTVVLRAIVGRDRHVHALHVISAPT